MFMTERPPEGFDMTENRRRGRPAGTEINDDLPLAKIADHLLASPDMKVSDAIRTVYTTGKHKGQESSGKPLISDKP